MDFWFKFFGPPAARTVGGPSEEGGVPAKPPSPPPPSPLSKTPLRSPQAAKYIYKEKTREEDVRFLIPVFSYLNKDELRGRVLELILKLPRQLTEVAIGRLLAGARPAVGGDRDDQVCGAEGPLL